MPNLLVVLANSRINDKGKEEFWYNTAYLLENGNKNVFIDFIKKGIIIVDINIITITKANSFLFTIVANDVFFTETPNKTNLSYFINT